MSYPSGHILLICFSILLLSCSTTEKTKPAEVTQENLKVVTETTPAIVGGLEVLYQQLTYPTNGTPLTSNITLEANVLVNSNGKVKQVSFTQEKFPEYKQAARQAIYKVRFVPGKRNGKAVDMFITIPIQFNAR